ncbi:MAG: Uma2 family endonuclease [Symploca sp. SIO2E6]|nr:Uma2 family endonuclease [Symploca sp. SIO2E6]
MTYTPLKLTFEQYLEYDDDTDNRYELRNGELVEVPPESVLNNRIARFLFIQLLNLVGFERIFTHSLELQVIGKTQTRLADLVVVEEVHLELMDKRTTITLDMPPPQLVVEVVSPYRNQKDENYQRDYIDKVHQYQERGIPEYWIVDPQAQLVTVLLLVNGQYQATEFTGSQRIVSRIFPELKLTAEQILQARE